MLEIKNLKVAVDGKIILDGINLKFNKGETHAIMGRNGSGKSSLAKVIAGDEAYQVLEGQILYEYQGQVLDLLELGVPERVWHGIFISYQYPVEVAGLSNFAFLKTIYNALRTFKNEDELDSFSFNTLVQDKIKLMDFKEEFLERSLNSGFSGGEKKRNELLQLDLLAPSFAVLDELDSGLDIDALEKVMNYLNSLKTPENTFVFISHYAKVISTIKPDFIHVMHNGKIIKSSNDKNLARDIELKGFDFLIDKK